MRRLFALLLLLLASPATADMYPDASNAVLPAAQVNLGVPVSVKSHGAIGDGVADDGPAFVAAAAAGGNIYVPPGNYRLGDATIVPASNTRMFAVPGTATLLKAPLVDSYKHPFFQWTDRKNITIEGLIFDEAGGGQREQAIIVLSTAPANSSDIRIVGNTFRNAGIHFARWVERVAVSNNVFTSNGSDSGAQAIGGIGTGADIDPVTGGTIPGDGPMRYLWIDSNYFENYRFEAVDINWDTRNVWITNNYIKNMNTTASTADEAIDVGGGDNITSWCENITVAYNTIEWDTPTISNGIKFKQYTRNSTIHGNTIRNLIYGSPMGGIIISNFSNGIEVTNNHVTGFDYGITAADASRIVFANNTIRDVGLRGVQVNTTTDGALISGNNISTTVATTPSHGIYVLNTVGYRIAGNAVTGGFVAAGGAGILTDPTATDGVIADNISYGNQLGFYNKSPRAVITGNIARNNQGHGFSLSGEHMLVMGNEAYDNSQVTLNQYGFNFLAGANYAIIIGNKSFDTQTTKTQNGMIFGASDRVIWNGNINYPVKATPHAGTTGLTNSLLGVAGNL